MTDSSFDVTANIVAAQLQSEKHLAWAQPEPDLVSVSAGQLLAFRQAGHPQRQQPIPVQICGDVRAEAVRRGSRQELRQRLIRPLVVVNALDLLQSQQPSQGHRLTTDQGF